MIIISTSCPFCGEEHEILVNEQDYGTWIDDELALRDAFPYLSAEEREMLMSGICPTCWDSIWGNDEVTV